MGSYNARVRWLIVLILLFPPQAAPQSQDGWQPLFDGRTLDGWRGYQKTDTAETRWAVKDGMLCLPANDGKDTRGQRDIISRGSYDQFELMWEWRVAPGANSGVKYFVLEDMASAIGHEYQVIDDERHPDALIGPHRQTSAFYDVLPASSRPLRPAGQFNQSRVVVRGKAVEHWLNGTKVLRYELESPALKEAVAKSKFKDVARFGRLQKGHVLLQDHGDAVCYRNLAIRTTAASAVAQQPAPLQEGQTIPLWAEPAPGALGTDESDIPAMTVFLPRTMRANTPAVVVCPGGSYVRLAANHEGRQVASYLNSLGIAAFVLRSRLGPRYHHPIEMGDAQRAIRTLRSRAADWRIDPARIGIMGFSAGGHLAMSASTRFDHGNAGATDPVERAGSRPDFTVLGYPVISMTAAWTHQGSKTNLLGDNPDAELARSLSGELAVTRETPPTFLFHTNADTTVPAENSVHYYLALRKAGVPAEMHIFENGAHGVGLANDVAALSEWSKLLANWLRVRGVI